MKQLVILMTLFGCFALRTNGQVMYGKHRVVFEARTKINLTVKRDTPYERFTPTLQQIDSADSIVQNYFKTNQKTKTKQIGSYYRQYVGPKTKTDQIIFIKAACVKPDDFSKNTFLTFGGGDCFFETDINLTGKEILYIYFNAPM